MIVYHGTAASFDRFRMRPSGLHFGTFDQAVHAATNKLGRLPLNEFAKLHSDPSGWRGRILRCELQILQPPLRVEDARTPRAWASLMRKHRKNHDCLVYVNHYEGRHAEDSYVIFDAKKVIILDDDFTRSGSTPSKQSSNE